MLCAPSQTHRKGELNACEIVTAHVKLTTGSRIMFLTKRGH